MEKSKKKKIYIIIAICIGITVIGISIYFITNPKLTIVFYQVECTNEGVTQSYTEEYVCAYFRLNTKGNHKLDVQDFSIYYNGKWQKASKAEYFGQTISVDFYTYPNQPILKVYFNIPHSVTESVVFTKYKNTEMRIGEFATTR